MSERSVEPLPEKITARIAQTGHPQPRQQPPRPQAQPLPQPEVIASQQPSPPRAGHWPQNNGVVKAIRNKTGHSPQTILDWCKANGAERPDQNPPDKLPALVEWLVLGWAQSHTSTPLEGLRNSYRGRVATMTASGQSLTSSALGWVEAQQERLAK